MILTCPECSARYLVDPKALLPHGRVVRCAKCKHSWRETAPDQDTPVVDSGESDGPQEAPIPRKTDPAQEEKTAETSGDNTATAETTIAEEEDEFAIRSARRKKRPRPVPKGSNLPALQNHKHNDSLWGWYSLAGFIAVLICSFIFFQSTIIDFWPPSKRLYHALGMTESLHSQASSQKTEPKIPLKDLFKIEDTVSNKIIKGQTTTLNVEGKIINQTDNTLTLPLLKISLMDDHGTIIREWTFKSSAATISEDEVVPFATSLPNPPETVTRVSVTFAEN